MSQYFVFDTFDNPMQLSKVGNWVITFLSPKTHTEQIELAMTSVVPRQIHNGLQPYRIHLHQTALTTHWQLGEIWCYHSQDCREVLLSSNDPYTQQLLASVLAEFSRYDVEITLSTQPPAL